jgi:hypothetical protein
MIAGAKQGITAEHALKRKASNVPARSTACYPARRHCLAVTGCVSCKLPMNFKHTCFFLQALLA